MCFAIQLPMKFRLVYHYFAHIFFRGLKPLGTDTPWTTEAYSIHFLELLTQISEGNKDPEEPEQLSDSRI